MDKDYQPGDRSSYRGKTKLLLFTTVFFFIFGILLISTFSSVKLTCERDNVNQVNCSLTRTAMFGFIDGQEISLNSLREVKLDERLKETVEADGTYNRATEKSVNVTPVYGVLLVTNKTTLLNGYAYNREKQQKIVNQINSLLNNSNTSDLVFQDINYGLDITTLISFGLSIGLLIRMLINRHHLNYSN